MTCTGHRAERMEGAMPVDYVSDYEQVTGLKIPAEVEVKVIASPPETVAVAATVAETPESE
ncbi:MAG: hypothetical protein ABI067_17670 [Leifsonia sp.]